MKSPFVVILLTTLLTCAFGQQQSQESVAVDFKGVTIAFHGDPRAADAKLLPLIDAKASGKERFGLCFGGADASGKALEIIQSDGSVLKTISIGALLAGNGEGFALVPRPAGSAQARWMEKRYAVDLPGAKVELLVKALATGDAASDRHLVVTYSLKSDAATSLGLRAYMPATGSIEASGQGFVLTSKNGSAALAVSVYPNTASVAATKSLLTVSSSPVPLAAGEESASLWLVLDGVAGGSANATKQQAARVLRDKRFGESDPRIVVVSNTDKPTTQPGEIVTYSVVCRNIGTGNATDVTLSNPVPEGMQYLDGSATTNGSIVSFDPATGAARNINWKFSAPIKPGDERLVTFKVRVQ